MFPFSPSSSEYHEDGRSETKYTTGANTGTSTNSTTDSTETSTTEPTQPNKWVGNVLPNSLDFYDNPTYNITLYMIPPVENSGSASQPDGDETLSDGSEKRKDTPSGENKKTGGGYLNGAVKAAPENTVILAKTGATAGVTIDNLELVTVTGPGGVQEKSIDFEIVQPGAASFPDMIVRAQQYLGIPTQTKDFPMFLEINFLGRTESQDQQETGIGDPDDGGKLTTIRGPYIYPLHLKNFTIQIDETGSRYNFSTMLRSELAYKPKIFNLPVLMTTTGNTITEHIKGENGLEKLLNDESKNMADKETAPDIIEFDLSGLIADTKSMKEESNRFAQGINLNTGLFNTKPDPMDIINNPNPVDRENAQRDRIAKETNERTKAKFKKENPAMIINETLTTTETTTLQKIPGLENISNPDPDKIQAVIEENKSSGFVTKKDSGKIEVYAKQGITIKEYFEMLLSMNDEFFQKISKVINPGQPFIKEDKNKTATAKFEVNAEVVDLEYNAERKQYAKKIIYKPTIFLTNQRTALTQEGLEPQDEDVAKKSMNEMKIRKAYSYIFTGRNDQIVSLDISYNNGLEFLLPVNGGLVGDPSLNTRHSSAEPVPANEDTSTIKDLFDKVAKVKDAVGIFNLFKGKDDILGNVAGILGFDPGDAKSFLSNANSASARAVADALSNKITRESISNLLLNKKGPSSQEGAQTDSDQQRIIDGSDNYEPTPSGYTYGLDLLGGTKQAEDLVKKEQQKRPEQNVKDTEESEKKASLGPVDKGNPAFTNNSPSMAVGQFGNRNSLIAYLFMQQATGRFLVDLDMTIRGDPWYLGHPSEKGFLTQESKESADTTTSDDNGIKTSSADNFFLLEINSPRYFDLNVEDEDANTGKWYESGKDSTSYFFSGVYRLLTATHKFANGFYSIDLRGAKETSIDLSQVTPNADYSFEAEESDTLRNRANEYEKTESDKDNAKSPSWIRGYITGDRAVAGLREGQPVTLSELLERKIITSEEAEAYRRAYPNG